MKIGIFTDVLNEHKTGIGYYTESLIQHLIQIDKNNEYYFIENGNIKREFKTKINSKKQLGALRILKKAYYLVPCKIRKHIYRIKIILSYKKNHYELNKADILFSPYFGMELQKRMLPKKIIIVYDLSPILLQKYYTANLIEFFKTQFPDIIKQADHLITISENTKKEIMACFGIPEEKISVIYPGKNKHIAYEPDFQNCLEKYNLPKEYILYVGTLHPRKNIPGLINAFARLKKDGYKEKLVLAGWILNKNSGGNYEELIEQIKKLNLEKEIIFTGYVDEADVPKLYSAAKLFAFPSFHEGFGIPVLEAMACRCPVITSNIAALPEVGGDAAAYVDPHDENSIYQEMKRVLSSPKLREEMIEKGLIQAKKFNWEDSAKKMIKIFEELNEKSPV